ncbi:hypothetical protein HTZ84_22580 [Haloterrigena sp. SYSU A558-1]|uniref:DUF4340 domain-containing protein n=1 Tax=Haloterrigena gelatinilytica TaxID=2741724 RepID=A0ABX2LFM8_9EURY|nr:hypothetical protein [Haloterrigena gelatinilytica]NUC75055.1 hypothetical protein [Haloterrigena gelatinilytica]
MREQLTTTLILTAVLALAAVGVGLAGASGVSSDADTLAIDNNHGLDEDPAVSEFHSEGYTETQLSQVDGSLAIATDKRDVDADGSVLPMDVRNNYVRIDYNEDFERTLRIHIPRDYQMPYSQSGVESITSDHSAEFTPVRGGEYLEIVVHVDEPTEIVLPLQKDSSASYKAVEWVDMRLQAATGASVFGSGDEWQYLSEDELAQDTAYEVDGNPEDVVVQYDAERADADETWLNAPKGEADDVGVYWFTRSTDGNETAYIVATDDDAPNVRYKSKGSERDRWGGHVRDALKNVDRIQERLGLKDNGDSGGDADTGGDSA